MSARRVYVASPLGFAAATRLYYRQVLLPALAGAGFEALDPWAGYDPEAPLPRTGEELRELYDSIGKANAVMIETAGAVLAVLDGADVDSGTAAEVGFAAALGKPVVGLREDGRQTGEPGAIVNLQVEYFIHSTGGAVTGDLPGAVALLGRLLP